MPIPTDNLGPVEEKKDKRKSVDYWRRWIKSSKKASRRHFDEAKEAWDEYEAREERPYPIYWSSVKTLEPAYYSKTPNIVTERAFGISDSVALTASTMSERMGRYIVSESDFDTVMHKSVLDFIHADKATTQIVYTSDFETIQVRVALNPITADTFADMATGLAYTEEVFQDPSGFFGMREEKQPKNQKVCIAECSYDEILHSPEAKSEAEIKAKAYYFFMDRSEAEGRFDKAVCAKINWRSKKDSPKKNDGDAVRDLTEIEGEYIEGWECWCKTTMSVYWVSDQYQEGFLDEKEDPYRLKGFFPSPNFIISSLPSKSLSPTSPFQHLVPCIEQLHDAATRTGKLMRGIRRRALVDGANDELIAALNSMEEGEYIAMTNLSKLVEKGGLEGSVLFIPVAELMKAITELSELKASFKEEFFEWFGVPDILRGSSDPIETAAAVETKVSAAHDRFKFQKKQVAGLARDSLEIAVDLAFSVFLEPLIQEIVGFNYMSLEDQQRFPEALALLRNSKVRVIRIAIETDTMTFVDEQQRSFKAQQVAEMLTNGLDKINSMVQTSPEYAVVGLQALLLSLNAVAPGKEFEDGIKKAVVGLIEKASQPPPPPKPDPMEIQAQAAIQVAQIKAQADGQTQQIRSQADMQIAQMKMQLDGQTQQMQAQVDLQIAQIKAQADAQSQQMRSSTDMEVVQIKAASDAQLESMKGQIKMMELQAASALEQQSTEARKSIEMLQAQMDIMTAKTKADLEREKAQADMQIKAMESALDMQLQQEKAKLELYMAAQETTSKKEK